MRLQWGAIRPGANIALAFCRSHDATALFLAPPDVRLTAFGHTGLVVFRLNLLAVTPT
jgi:hypothetical protein